MTGGTSSAPSRRHRLLLVSDFFYPNFGGVESHIYYLSQCLIARGHKVVVLTHAYGDRSGIRWMTSGLKVYYVPRLPFYSQNTFPTLYGALALLRDVIVRERVDIIHGHQAFSNLAHEALLHARTMGYKTVFTDHSLFGFADASSIHTNKLLKFTLADVHQIICVSHTSKENTALRSGLPPQRISVIPNAVDTAVFTPDPTQRQPGRITIVIMSRLVYRKGADLLLQVIPEVCRRWPQVHFLIGGDGPKKANLEQMREKHGLTERVAMLGAVPHSQVRDVLVQGHIFLNSSLTEAFCIAILEAASCGLLTVSTRVGGVPEVLPPDMLVLAEPVPEDIVRAVGTAIALLPKMDPTALHQRVRQMYSWHNVAIRTEKVYDLVARAESSGDQLIERLKRYYACGSWAGKLFCMVAVLDYVLWRVLEWLSPSKFIEVAPDLT